VKVYPVHWTFVDTFAICFVGKDNLAPRRSSSSVVGSASVHQGGGPLERPERRSSGDVEAPGDRVARGPP
jgi:hypothetical protein